MTRGIGRIYLLEYRCIELHGGKIGMIFNVKATHTHTKAKIISSKPRKIRFEQDHHHSHTHADLFPRALSEKYPSLDVGKRSCVKSEVAAEDGDFCGTAIGQELHATVCR